MAGRARLLLAQNPYVRRIYTAIGGGSTGGDPDETTAASIPDICTAVLTLSLTPRSDREGVRKQEIERQLRDSLIQLPGVRIAGGMGGSSEK